jgi:hypothetical protein
MRRVGGGRTGLDLGDTDGGADELFEKGSREGSECVLCGGVA